MSFKRRSIVLFLILVLVCIVCVESKAKKWRAHIKKKSHSPKISASFRIVPPKRKIIHKHKTVPHKRYPKMEYYHPLPSSWPTHTLPSTKYYLASNYPRYRSYLTTPTTTLRKLDPYITSSYSYEMPLRRSDEFDATSLVDMSAMNADFGDGFYDPGLNMQREFVQPEISLGGWTPIDYKTYLGDGDFSLVNEQMMMSRELDGGGLMYSNPFEPRFI